MTSIQSLEELRSFYEEPKGRAVLKQLKQLEEHSNRFIKLSPFVVISTVNSGGRMDASPRGGEPGFVKILDQQTLAIPDFKGNNRLDSLQNIIETSQVGLLFMIPGVDETLRVNGKATIEHDQAQLQQFEYSRVPPKTYIKVTVEELFLHCAKALMRSRLWDSENQLERSQLPTMGTMLNDQIGSEQPVESQAEMVERYQKEL